MRTFSLKNILIATSMLAGLAIQVLPAYAFDASKVIKSDTSSTKVFEFFFTFKNKGQKQEAVQVLKYAAENGNSAAQWKLARLYQTGDGVKADPIQAFSMFEKIASQYPLARPNTPNWQFSADALVQLGNYYKNGISNSSIHPDRNKAQMMYTTAAMVFRHPGAQFELGRMQLSSDKGFGQHRLGIRNLSLAYKKGHIGAEALLGYAYFEGEYVKHDPVRGLVMLSKAKEACNARDLIWIKPLYDEAYALATPDQRLLASAKLEENSVSID